MSILFVGCSFTNGMELKDKQVSRFSAIVSKELGYNQWNEGKVGGGNDYIQRTVFNAVINNQLYFNTPLKNLGVKKHGYHNRTQIKGDYIEKFMFEDTSKEGVYHQTFQTSKAPSTQGKPKLVVCMWSGINRHEVLRKSIIANTWSWTINTWARFGLDPKSLLATQESKAYCDNQYYPGTRDILEGYMKRVRNGHMNLRLTIGNMLAVKYFLQSQGIPQLHYVFSSGQYKPLLPVLDWDVYENTNTWWEGTDIDRKTAVRELPVLESEGFYDMTKRLNLPIGAKDHPLEEAHEAMAQRIIEDIKKNEFLK